MSDLSIRLKHTDKTGNEARIYFTSHPDDLACHFETVVKDIFDTTESIIYYTKDMTSQFAEDEGSLLLSGMQLFVVPVTLSLLTKESRTMEYDIPFARRMGIPILPIMMEGGLDALYSATNKFGEIQYVSRASNDESAIPYGEKLSKFLSSVLISRENEERVRSDFAGYVFLSYRKKDRAYANMLLKRIHSDPALSDVAVWYDEFLSPGESFRTNISEALGKSSAMLLLVTPSLLEDGNFVMSVEYPAARSSGIKIIPIEMQKTDMAQLCAAYPGIPAVTDFGADDFLYNIKSALCKNETAEAWAARHKYLMGIAYLYGIDMEVDRERGLDLIYSAARENHYDAMLLLWDYYRMRVAPEGLEAWLASSIYLYRADNFGDEHPETLDALYEVAILYSASGKYERAREWLSECYETRCRILGEKHPDTLKTLETIGWTHRNEGEREKSLEIFERVFALRTETLGIEHFSTASSIISLLGEYEYFENYAKILELNKLIYELNAAKFGEGHYQTLTSLNKLVVEYRSYARKNEAQGAELLTEADLLSERAIALGERECARLSRELGDGHPETLEQLMTLAESYSLLGDEARALSIYEGMRPHYAALYGEDGMQVSSLDFRIYNLTDGKDELEKIAEMSIDELSAFLFDELSDDADFGSFLDDTDEDDG